MEQDLGINRMDRIEMLLNRILRDYRMNRKMQNRIEELQDGQD